MPNVYITGLGFVSSIGNDAAGVAQSLRDLRHGIETYAPFQKPDIPAKVVGTIKDFNTDSYDAEDWTFPSRYNIRREIIRGMAPHGVYSYCAMMQAVEDARLTEADISNPHTGLYAASGGSPRLISHLLNRMYSVGVMRCSPLGIVASVTGTVQFNLVAHFKIKGASAGFASACASSAHALAFAYDEIAHGRQKRMFVIGAEDCNMDSILPFAGMRALSLQSNPNLASRPFDVARDGFVGTGGAAISSLSWAASLFRSCGSWPAASFAASDVRRAISSICPPRSAASRVPSPDRALASASNVSARLFRIAASRSARARGSRTPLSSWTITPLRARRPSIRAGARPVSAATSRASFTALARAAGSIFSPRAAS